MKEKFRVRTRVCVCFLTMCGYIQSLLMPLFEFYKNLCYITRSSSTATKCFTDFGKLNFPMVIRS